MSGESRYIRGDVEINRLRSGRGLPCPSCGVQVDEACVRTKGPRAGDAMLYVHLPRRLRGEDAADALVIARGRGRNSQ